MLNFNATFDGKKLKFARELRGLTLKEVADEMHVSHQSVSKWENNNSVPSFNELEHLGNYLKLGRLFFFSAKSLPENNSATFFRRNVSVTKKNRKMAEHNAKLFSYVEGSLSKLLKLKYYQELDFAILNKKFTQLNPEIIEKIANEVRDIFGTGIGPISNVTLLIERLGIRVAFKNLSLEQVVAVTEKLNNRQYIIINTYNRSSVRIRFNLAHELGHVLLHSKYLESDILDSSNRKRIEWEANYFAGCLLMPEDGIAQDMSYTNLSYLTELKNHWKVSIQALVTRGIQIGLIDELQGLHLRQQISRNGWRKEEPLDKKIPIEHPVFLRKAVEFSDESENYILSKINYETGLPISLIENQLNLHNKEDKCTEVKFKLI